VAVTVKFDVAVAATAARWDESASAPDKMPRARPTNLSRFIKEPPSRVRLAPDVCAGPSSPGGKTLMVPRRIRVSSTVGARAVYRSRPAGNDRDLHLFTTRDLRP